MNAFIKIANFITIVMLTFAYFNMVSKRDALLMQVREQAALTTQWEQRWRDCQAALSMLRTPHAADAVSDVTQP